MTNLTFHIWSSHSSIQHGFELGRILGRIAGFIIVKIHIHGRQAVPPQGDPARPRPQLPGGIISLIFSAGTVKPDIHEIGRQLVRRFKAIKLIQTERGIVPSQSPVDGRIVPTRIAKFKRVSVASRQCEQ